MNKTEHLGATPLSERMTLSIPPLVREKLDLKPHDSIQFVYNNGKVILKKVDWEKINGVDKD